MKWFALMVVAGLGMHAVHTNSDFEVADDVLVIHACGRDPDCIRRHNMARRTALGVHVFDPTVRRLPYAPLCPTALWVAFQACHSETPQ